MDGYQFVNTFIALLVITNPIMILSTLLLVTAKLDQTQKKYTASVASLVAGAILVTMTWIGPDLLQLLGIHLKSFEIAGGCVVILIAHSMLQAKESSVKTTTEEQGSIESGAIIPLAFPIIAGPGAISTTIINAALFPELSDHLLLSLSCLLNAFLGGLCIYYSDFLKRRLGPPGINIFTRLGGLILLAFGIQLFGNGVKAFFGV